ncbi:MAG: hypothetical protein H6Q90_1204 [Deltaproteobacteria bacterium]|nr:hypothetical protein [Deltaproteobacteria bacterium]
MHRWLILWVAGCSFHPPSAAGDAAGSADPTIDADVGSDALVDGTPHRDIPHLPSPAELPGSAALSLSGQVTIDTTLLMLSTGAPPSGVSIEQVAQDPGGSSLMVIHADVFTVTVGSVVRVVGTRPLVIVARTISIAGVLDASANTSTRGAGGHATGDGNPAGGGSAGAHVDPFHDSGGGGGGFGATAARGGSAGTNQLCLAGEATGGPPGDVLDLPAIVVLQGGGAGGAGSPGDCPAASNAPGGAGGGAIQLSATETLVISGIVHAGGGGGTGGVFCNTVDSGSGGGGGAGGAIYLDAPAIAFTGALLANGGGGGGGGCAPDGAGSDGADGSATGAVATGGNAGGGCGTLGGNGGTNATAPGAGLDQSCDGNAGGGGGAVGRIVARGTVTGAGQVSPSATALAF